MITLTHLMEVNRTSMQLDVITDWECSEEFNVDGGPGRQESYLAPYASTTGRAEAR